MSKQEGADNDPALGDDESDFKLEDEWDFESEDVSKILKGLEALIPGIVKRSIISGLANISEFSEDGLKSVVTDKNIPKEAVGFVLTSADATRREILRIVSREVQIFLQNMDFGGELAKILTTLSFEIRTEIRFVPNDEKVKPNIRHRVKLKRVKEDGKEETLSDMEDGPSEPSQETEAPPKSRRWSRRKRPNEEPS